MICDPYFKVCLFFFKGYRLNPLLPHLSQSLLFRTKQGLLLYQVNGGFWVRWLSPLNFTLLYELPC